MFNACCILNVTQCTFKSFDHDADVLKRFLTIYADRINVKNTSVCAFDGNMKF